MSMDRGVGGRMPGLAFWYGHVCGKVKLANIL